MFKNTCWICGKEYEGYNDKYIRRMCPECKTRHDEEIHELVETQKTVRSKLMYENAIRKLESTHELYDFEIIRDSMEFIEELIEYKPEAFKSTAEVITAIMLHHDGFEFKVNHRVDRYILDFYIPEEKIDLEIDGFLHKGKRAHDGKRDVELRLTLGKEWEVIRIPVKYVESAPMSLTCHMLEVAKKQRKLRKENGGILPQSYSPSVRAYYESVLN